VSESHYAKTWLLDPRAPFADPPHAVKLMRKKGNIYAEGGAAEAGK
jgi:hypothetical protein